MATRRREMTMQMTGEHERSHATRGEAHYRDFMVQLQSEFTRVVASLETRAASLAEHNELLQNEVEELRDELFHVNSAYDESHDAFSDALREAKEQQQMQQEESATRLQQAAQNEDEWRATCEQLTRTLQEERKQWESERTTQQSELQRVSKQLQEATCRLADEQQSNAHMSQEIQLLQCRVDNAVKTSRSFEQRLQQLKQLKKDEKQDLEIHITHLQKRLDDKNEQNQYLAEALMEKESHRHDQRTRAKDAVDLKKASTRSGSPSPSSSSFSSVKAEPRDRVRRRDQQQHHSNTSTSTTTDATMQRREYRYLADLDLVGRKRRSAMEDILSHAPTSPTSSSSPPSTPSMTMRSTLTIANDPTATTAQPQQPRERRRSGKEPTTTLPSQKSLSSSPRHSERLQRELLGLRRKLERACLPQDQDHQEAPRAAAFSS